MAQGNDSIRAARLYLMGDKDSTLPRQTTKPACIIGAYCRSHGFIHGAEAEELRERLEALDDPRVNAILYNVDARDSLAFTEGGK
jgi:hypothetical protein